MAAAEESRKCAFFVTKRGRNCRMTAAKGSLYCGEHMLVGGDATTVVLSRDNREMERERILCPLDPSHTVYRHLLHKHLKNCNAAKRPTLACYTKNINSGLLDHLCSPEEMAPLSTFPPEVIEALISKVEAVYCEHAVKIEQDIRDHPVLLGELADPKYGATALKHLKQRSSILGHLHSLDMLVPKTCFIEFGAGKGKLSDVVQRTLSVSDGCHCVLVDKAACRRKAENHHKKMNECASFQRLLIDIEHLDLGKLQCLHNGQYTRTVGIGKHLCGAATDFSLRCLLKTLPSNHVTMDTKHHHDPSTGEPQSKRLCQHPDLTPPSPSLLPPSPSLPPPPPSLPLPSSLPPSLPSPSPSLPPPSPSLPPPSPPHLEGILLAVCCHHRCTWSSVLGREYLEGVGFGPVDFHLISHMSSWAVCGVRTGGTEWDHSEEEGSTLNCHTHYVPHPKEEIGLKCKRLIDAARVWGLQQAGLDAKLVYFVDRNTSLENVLLIATTKREKPT